MFFETYFLTRWSNTIVNLDPDKETAKSRLATENWDASLIVTTNVQFFESLFAARTSRCRKLHNIVNSVVVLDEAQLLPPEFLQPILDVMNLLVRHYNVTFVLSTATQPALGTLRTFQRKIRGLDQVHEIIDDPDALYRDLERVTVSMPQDLHQAQDWDDIVQQIQQHPCALVVVNSRADARELHRRMPEGTIHLSALMCGEHRSRVIADVKTTLAYWRSCAGGEYAVGGGGRGPGFSCRVSRDCRIGFYCPSGGAV